MFSSKSDVSEKLLLLESEIAALRLENSLLRNREARLQAENHIMILMGTDDQEWLESALDRLSIVDDDLMLRTIQGVDSLAAHVSFRQVLLNLMISNARCMSTGRFISLRPCTNFFAPRGQFSERDDDAELIQDLFAEIDTNRNHFVSFQELESAMHDQGKKTKFKKYDPNLFRALKNLLDSQPCKGLKEITFDSFSKVFEEVPRVRGERVRWARTLKLEELLASLLKKGSVFDGLKGLRELSVEDMEKHILDVTSRFSVALPRLLRKSLKRMKIDNEQNALLFKNSKFSMDGHVQGTFAELEDFHKGPEKLIGAPNPKIEVGIKREHCERSNSSFSFLTTNYNFWTCPKDEYEFVVEPQVDFNYPHTPRDKSKWNGTEFRRWKGEHGRDVLPIQLFMASDVARQAKLERGEVISLRLYTGPCFVLYNTVLRKWPRNVLKRLKGNRYETTIFCIISGVTKLSTHTKIPESRKLYRGLSGLILPDQFWMTSGSFRGGVEKGFMSTTANLEVAMQYSGIDKKRGTVFEITAGRIDIGAELTWISQYPGEAEYLFPPLSCLEVIDEPRVENGVIIFPLRVNMNIKGSTLEMLVGRRKNLHLSMAKNLRLVQYLAFVEMTCISR